MKTISYNEQTHRLVPVEPTESMAAAGWDDAVEHEADNVDIYDIAAIYRAMLSAAPVFDTIEDNLQPEPVELRETQLVEVEPVLYAEFSEDGGWLGEASEYQDHLEEPIALYTAPPDYEEIKRQRDDLVKALEHCRSVFDKYISIHLDKSPADYEKAAHNESHRAVCDTALASVKGGV